MGRMGTLALLAVTACAPTVRRVAPDTPIDLSGRWNDADSRQVAEALVAQSLADPHNWAVAFHQRTGRWPVVVVGSVRNDGEEPIPVAAFVRELERAWVASGRVRVVASPAERGELRAEKQDQQLYARPDARTPWAQETGADVLLQGAITTIHDVEGRRQVRYYQVDVALVDLRTHEKIWTGQHRIKKFVARPWIRW